MSLDLNSTSVEYKDNKVIIKSMPKNGENLSVFMRPGDEVVFDIEGLNSDELEYVLVGGDIVVSFANEGMLTFPSLGLMGFSSNPPIFNFGGNKSISVDSILSKIEEINELPITSVDASFKITTSNDEGAEAPSSVQVVVVTQGQSTSSSGAGSKTQDFSQETSMSTSSQSSSLSMGAPVSDPYNEMMPKNDFDGYKQDNDLIPKPNVDVPPEGGSGDDDGDGDYDEPPTLPDFHFKTTVHQVTYSETISSDRKPLILGGGGSLEGYANASETDQFAPEIIDMSARSENMIIRSENSTYFDNDPAGSEYLSKVMRFEPQMPLDYYLDSFSIAGGSLKILDKNGVEINGGVIFKDDMVFKEVDGKTTIEFTIQYDNTISSPFNISITANYKLDPTSDKTELPHNVNTTHEYTVAIKDISVPNDYKYEKGNFSGFEDAKEEGFILSKTTNTNIIKDGSGHSIIVGGLGIDEVSLGAGDDTVYLSGGNDIVHSGAGHNTIYGNSYLKEDGTTVVNNGSANDRDKVSYDQVESFSLAELKYLKDNSFITSQDYQKLIGEFQQFDENGKEIPNTLIDVEMQKYYNGVYVDLNGFSLEALLDEDGNIIEGEKINALSKFSLKKDFNFTYDSDGNVTGVTVVEGTVIPQAGLENIQLVGQDKYKDINDIDGSAYNDTIYGNSDKNIIHGLAGNDYIDGRDGGNELYGGAGNDTLVSGSGNDKIDGGEDSDTVSYQNATNGVTVRLDRPNGEQYDDFATGHGNDTLISIENVIGSNHNDTIFGSSSTNYIEGMGGDDYIFSGQGINFIDGGDGVDKISYNAQDYRVASPGNTNENYIKYLDNLGGINVTLGNDFAMVRERSGVNKDALIDLVKDIEQVSGSRGNDYIRGTNKAETFWGNDGDDELRGEGGNDLLYGGAGNDIIRPGSGLDKSWGGTEVDYLELYDDGINTQAVTNAIQRLRLSDSGTIEYSYDATTRTDGTWNNGYDAHGGINEAYEFEGFGGSNGDNIMYGNSQANVLNGHGGNDIIYGIAGANHITGGADNDTIYGGTGDDTIYGHSVYDWARTNQDTIDGGGGKNTLNYSSAGHGGFNLNMKDLDADGYATVYFAEAGLSVSNKITTNKEHAFDDKIKNIHNIIGSGNNDVIYANDSGMTLDGWGGVDKLYGGAGNDTIIARNSAGEVLDGGSHLVGGIRTGYVDIDTLKLAQNVNFRNIDVSNFEILELGSYAAYFNLNSATLNQWSNNSFNKIVGDADSKIYLYGTSGNDTFDISAIDLGGFSGQFNIDASGGSDTLKMGTTSTQKIEMLDNYYNTFETFDIASGSTLEVNAYNNSGRTFNAHNKDFTAVNGEIKLNGGGGNDTFISNYEALLAGKLKIDGGSGNDIVDVRTASTAGLTFTADMFKNIETLKLDTVNSSNSVNIDAEVMRDWFSGNDFYLDLANNNSQAEKINITNANITAQNGDTFTGFEIGGIYHIDIDGTNDYNLHIV